MKATAELTCAGCVLLLAGAAFAVNFPLASGDMASNGSDGWNGTMPGAGVTAQFNKGNGIYTASDDVEFGSLSIQGNGTVFNMAASGDHTVKLANLYMGYFNVSATINGGVWDMSGAVSGAQGLEIGSFAACNKYGTYKTTLTLAKNCLVTNASLVRLGYESYRNTMRITDSSRVYTQRAALFASKRSGNGRLEVLSGGRLTVLTGDFLDSVGLSESDLVYADTTNVIVVAGEGSAIECPSSVTSGDPRGFVVGNLYGRNSLEVSEGGELIAPFRFVLGYGTNANTNRAVFETGAKFTLRDMRIGESGSHGNSIEFRSGASGTVVAGGRIGGWEVAGSGNRMVVSNATVTITGVLAVGCPKDGADVSEMSDNALVMRGDSSGLTVEARLAFRNRSLLRFDVPVGGYAPDTVSITAQDVFFDDTSALEIGFQGWKGRSGRHVLIDTAGGITIPDSVFAAANAALAVQSGGMARLVSTDDGKALALDVSRSLTISVR